MEEQASTKTLINNAFYEDLSDGWYTDGDHPIALLRAENAVRAPWVAEKIRSNFTETADILDVGCGGGFLTNYLAMEGHRVTGIDISFNSLETARRYDKTGKVHYLYANAYELPFESGSFDVVCAMDILEHVEEPGMLIHEASRVLRSGGLFFFHTFNRNVLSYLLVIKGVDWFVKNAPKNMHVYELFIKPEELKAMCKAEGLTVVELSGFTPKMMSLSFWKMAFTRKVPPDFAFQFVKGTATGYCGWCSK